MEFWGVEVKSGVPVKVAPGHSMVLHVSQASVGELKKEKGNESVCLFVNVDGKKLVLGTLLTEKLPQQQLDLVFDRDFELSHNWKNGTVYFYGYRASNPYNHELPEGESDEFESDEELPLMTANKAKPEPKEKSAKPAETSKANAAKGKESDAGKQKVKIVEPSKDDDSEEDDDSSDGLMSEDDEDDSEDEDDSDDESGESDEETPKKVESSKKRAVGSASKTPVESSKKRAVGSASKTPVQDKKAKVTPQKTDGKKVSGHVATPHPAKQAGKTPGNKPNQQIHQSGGSHSCKSCSRTFGSEKALESHSKAKHGSK